ncbi:MAG: RimK/LysX family protein [Acidimicrobiales bacterium]
MHDRRLIRSSNGQQQSRIIIKTRIEMAGATWPIELSLASRDELGFRVSLIGRQGLGKKVLIDVGPFLRWQAGHRASDMTDDEQRLGEIAEGAGRRS